MSLPSKVKPTKKQVENWYKKACLEQLNIFDDLNLIILILSKTLLDEWSKIKKNEITKNKK